MSRLFFSGIALLFNFFCFAQGFVNNGAEISVTDGGLLAICGSDANYINLNDGCCNGLIDLKGDFELKGNWINNSLSGVFVNDLTDGNIIFSGDNEQLILGAQITDFENIILKKSNALKLENVDCLIHGNLLILNGLFDLNKKSVVISGNWENYDSFSSNDAYVFFNSSKIQRIISGNCNFSNIVFNNSSPSLYDVDIQDDIVIDKFAEFINGIVYTSNNSSICFNIGALSNGGSDSSFVCEKVTKICKDEFVFPIGKVNNSNLIWAPLQISSCSANDIFSCEYMFTAPPNNFNSVNMSPDLYHVSGVEFWNLNQIAGASSPFVSLYSKDNTRSGITFPDNIVVSYYDSNMALWSSLGGTYNMYANYGDILSDMPCPLINMVTFGTKYSANPLPVCFLDFYAKCNDNYIEINWSTASETNSKSFIIEKSTNLTHWDYVANIPANGNSNKIINYSFNDNFLIRPYITYYRIRQIDIDGNEIVLTPIDVNCFKNNENIYFNVYPNPFSDNINLEIIGNIENNILVELFDINSKIIFSKSIDVADIDIISLNFNNYLPKGVFLFSVNYYSKVFFFKLFKL